MALLPFFALAWYSHPSSDDFLLANGVHEHGVVGYQHYMYFNWTGRYSSVLLWSVLNPVAYSGWQESYKLMPALFLLTILVVFYLMLRGLLRNSFSRLSLWRGSGVLFMLLLFQLPSTAEGIYWVTGIYNYLLPGLLVLLLLVAMARRACATTAHARSGWLLAAVILAVLIVGGNEIVALPLLAGVASITLVQAVQLRRIPHAHLLLTAVVAGACAVSFLAPGNYIRMAGESQHYGLVKAGILATAAAAYSSINWLGNGVLLAVTLLLLPLSQRLAQRDELPLNQLVRNPLLITALLFGLLAAGFFPSFWASGAPIPLRARNMLYLFFLIGWFLQAHAWVRYVVRQRHGQLPPLPTYARVLLGAWLLLAFATDHNLRLRGPQQLANSNNTVLAYREWLGGAAARYDTQLRSRYQQLRAAPPGSRVSVAALQEPPFLLSFLDLSVESPQDWTNQEYARFFHLREIRALAAP